MRIGRIVGRALVGLALLAALVGLAAFALWQYAGLGPG